MRVSIHARGAAPLAAAIAAVLLAGCGSSGTSSNGLASKTPAQIVQAAKVAAAGAVSAHVTGSIVSAGKPISLDMELVAGKGGKGTIALQGLTVDLIDIGNEVYLNGSNAFYSHLANSAAARLLQGKWLKVPADSGDFASFASLANLGELIDSALAAHGALRSAPSATVEGQPAVGVTDGSRDGTLYVAATGTPYPLELVKSGANGGTVKFSHWNKPVTLNPPADWININQLRNGR